MEEMYCKGRREGARYFLKREKQRSRPPGELTFPSPFPLTCHEDSKRYRLGKVEEFQNYDLFE